MALSSQETIELSEHDRSPPLELGEDSLRTIDQRINKTATRLGYEHTSDGSVRLTTSSHVGLVSLPTGTQVRIKPKAAGENFLRLLLYASGTTAATVDSTVAALEGDLFLDAIGALFLDRLEELVQRGLGKEYQTKQDREEYLRGRLDVQRQLSRGKPTATSFEIEYENLTHDTVENQAVLYAAHLLTRLVDQRSVQQSLQQRTTQLRREVTLRPVQSAEIKTVHFDRLNQYYEDILHLASLIIEASFVDNLEAGSQETYGILLNMNRIFEQVVERAATEAVAGKPRTVEEQARIDGLVTGGDPEVNMYPDFVIRDQDGNVQLVGDAKWKTSRPSQSDIYQMTSYQLADDVPGLLLYPAQNGAVETEYVINNQLALHLRELPTNTETTDLRSFGTEISKSLAAEFERVLTNPIS